MLLWDISSPPPTFGMFPLEKGAAEAGFAALAWLVAAPGVVGSGRCSQSWARHRNGCSRRWDRVGVTPLG